MLLGSIGDNSVIGIPADIKNPKNIFLGDNVKIGRRSTIMTVGSGKLIIKDNTGSAEGLTVISSNHRQHVGEILDGSNSNNQYQDVIVEEDVWIGANVTLLAGSLIGRGSIIGAGCVVRGQKIPPYSIVVGNPAKIIGFKFSLEEIIEHEKLLYNEENRINEDLLRKNYEKYYNSKLINISKYIKL